MNSCLSRRRLAAALAACLLTLGTGAPAAKPAIVPPAETAMLDPAELARRLGTFEEGRWILANSGKIGCGVQVYKYEYRTVDGRGRVTTASAALMLPRGDGAACRGPVPIVLALHGTMPNSAYNLADVSGGNIASPRALAWAATYAAHGYAVIAPNYAGYDTSKLDYHPYLDRRQQTNDVIDALAAARRLMPAYQTRDSGKLFVTGYSQGGWLAMAVHRELEARGQRVAASMPGSGPYALAALADDIFLGRPVQGSTVYFPLGVTSFQRAGGNIYRDPGAFFNPRYARGIEDLLPSPKPFATLVAEGRVPASALFDSVLPDLPAHASPQLKALFAWTGPTHGPALFKATYASGFGAEPLVHNPTRLAYLEDMAAHPDGAGPVWRDGAPARRAANPLRRAFVRNDLRGWIPRAPLTMCGGSTDAAVPFRFGAELMMRIWSTPGTAAPAGRVAMIDFDRPAAPGELWASLKANLTARHAEVAAARGEETWTQLYHEITLPRYCYTAARIWFDGMR